MRENRPTVAKARLPELLQSVEYSETVVKTQHVKEVAHPIPALVEDRASRARAVEQFRRHRTGWQPVDFCTREMLAVATRHGGHRL